MADVNVEVDLEKNSPYRVALDLAYSIARTEGKEGKERNRGYWLRLYAQCRKVVKDGRRPEDVLKDHDDDED
jgi:hypothetical protein